MRRLITDVVCKDQIENLKIIDNKKYQTKWIIQISFVLKIIIVMKAEIYFSDASCVLFTIDLSTEETKPI